MIFTLVVHMQMFNLVVPASKPISVQLRRKDNAVVSSHFGPKLKAHHTQHCNAALVGWFWFVGIHVLTKRELKSKPIIKCIYNTLGLKTDSYERLIFERCCLKSLGSTYMRCTSGFKKLLAVLTL